MQIPHIDQQPNGRENVTLGETVRFDVEATGVCLSYTWHHHTSEPPKKQEVGGNNQTLCIDKVKSDDEGIYTCTIRNPAGDVDTEPAQLTMSM